MQVVHQTCRVHPRVGGGTGIVTPSASSTMGPSPRGRGNPARQAFRKSLLGSIPAWAGEPRSAGHVAARLRSIPAWAGEPCDAPFPPQSRRVHPRVGGGTTCCVIFRMFSTGPSPRGRGNPVARVEGARPGGSIPAWAGEPACHHRRQPPRSVHPRVGGGTGEVAAACQYLEGPSPRGRGNHRTGQGPHLSPGSIPAWAGEPSGGCASASWTAVHPRVGGGTRGGTQTFGRGPGPSPRGRGNHG